MTMLLWKKHKKKISSYIFIPNKPTTQLPPPAPRLTAPRVHSLPPVSWDVFRGKRETAAQQPWLETSRRHMRDWIDFACDGCLLAFSSRKLSPPNPPARPPARLPACWCAITRSGGDACVQDDTLLSFNLGLSLLSIKLKYPEQM